MTSQAALFAPRTPAPAVVRPAPVQPRATYQTVDQYSSDRHRPGSVLRRAIHNARDEMRGSRHACLSLVNLNIGQRNMALWRRGQPMRAWAYAELFAHQAYGPARLPC